VCNKKVEEMEIDQYSGGPLEITVKCHGEVERFTLDPRFAAAMDKNTEVRRVFVRDKIENKKGALLP